MDSGERNFHSWVEFGLDCGVVEMGLCSILKLHPVLYFGICIPKLAHWVMFQNTHAKSMLHVPFNGDMIFKEVLEKFILIY
ncbi:hypothetical protein QL285_096009 [Trifolium repens]|jgi:hypothetical protein|nr:hypothetical protein QL285_096009 [Trifolium repens]